MVKCKTSRGDLAAWLEANKDHIGDKCLIWPFHRDAYGYAGAVTLGKVKIKAYRAACIWANGAPPTPRHEAAHSCGRGHEGCVDPRHLSWKTRKENVADRVLHGTSNNGERNGRAKLVVIDILLIKNALSRGESCISIAKRHQVHPDSIRRIKRGATWSR